ncbi:hypothetical protein EC991_009388 [Linnemannia zychae]|nr:hypothetical protein EC991_009388 [Linnemannia zychae]
MKCYLIFCTIVDCGCRTCNAFTKCETIQFIDSPGDTYGMIPLDQFEKSIIFDICWDHQMMMNLIPWSDLESASVRDLDLYVCGWKRNTKWLDSAVVAGKMCKISVEIFCPILWAPVIYQQCYARHQYQQQQQHHYHQQQRPPPLPARQQQQQHQQKQQYKSSYYQQHQQKHQQKQQYKSSYYQQQPPQQQQQQQQQYRLLYYQQHPPQQQLQQQKSHLRRMSTVATSVLGEVVKEKLLEAAFELTIDLGMQFFLGC